VRPDSRRLAAKRIPSVRLYDGPFDRVDDDIQEAIADDGLSEEEYVTKWGALYTQTSVEAGRRNNREFAQHAYRD
jgi:hypothetical protein